MARFDTSTVQTNLIYDYYLDGADRIYNMENMLYNKFADGSDSIEAIAGVGLQATWALRTGRSGAIGPAGDGGALPGALKIPAFQAKEPLYFNYATLRLTAAEMEATRGNLAAFIGAMEREVDGAMDGLTKWLNISCYSGTPGAICRVNGTPTDPVIAAAGTAITVNEGIPHNLPDFMAGMAGKTFLFTNPGRTAVRTGTGGDKVQLVSVPTSNTELQIRSTGTAAVNISDNDWLVMDAFDANDTANGGDRSQMFWGLAALINDSGTVHGVNPTTNPLWKSNVSSGANISENVFRTPALAIRQNYVGTPPMLSAVGHPEALSVYYELAIAPAVRRFDSVAAGADRGTGKPSVLVNGDTTVSFESDIDCYPKNTVYLLQMDEMACFKGGGMEWVTDLDGGNRWRVELDSTGAERHSWTAKLVMPMSIGVKKRNAHARLNGFGT